MMRWLCCRILFKRSAKAHCTRRHSSICRGHSICRGQVLPFAYSLRGSCEHLFLLNYFFWNQGVGGNGGAHFHGGNLIGGNRCIPRNAQQIADAGQRCVGILRRVFRQQLVSGQRTIGPARDDIGKSAAAIDPELPAGGCECVFMAVNAITADGVWRRPWGRLPYLEWQSLSYLSARRMISLCQQARFREG